MGYVANDMYLNKKGGACAVSAPTQVQSKKLLIKLKTDRLQDS